MKVSKVSSALTKNFVRDGASVTDPVLSDSAATYTPGISESRSGVSSFYGNDSLGSKTMQTNSSSAVTCQVSYDASGNQKSSTGSSSSPFRFVGSAGYQKDNDSGLMLLGHRYYDSSTGRFLTRDPVKYGNNWYDYVGNNPANRIDQPGYQAALAAAAVATAPLDWEPLGWGILIGIGIAVVYYHFEEHGKRGSKGKSNRGQHQAGQSRTRADGGGEKGGQRRPLPGESNYDFKKRTGRDGGK